MPVLVTNCIPVNNAHAIDFEDRFVHRINHVDEAPGFIRNEVLRPALKQFDHASGGWREAGADDPSAVYRIATLWETMEDFVEWTRSPSFALAHAQKTPRDMFTNAPALDIHEVFLTTVEDEATGADGPPRQGVLVTNCIPVNQAHAIDFEDRFAKRIHHVDAAPGFIRNEVLRPAPKQFDHASGKWKDTTGGGVSIASPRCGRRCSTFSTGPPRPRLRWPTPRRRRRTCSLARRCLRSTMSSSPPPAA